MRPWRPGHRCCGDREVAADDGVMPQTSDRSRPAAADVPILIAVNKSTTKVQSDRIRTDLAADGSSPEDWGGDDLLATCRRRPTRGLDNTCST